MFCAEEQHSAVLHAAVNCVCVNGGVAADLKLYYDVGRALANTTDWPNWVDGDEFRAIRDKDRAGK